jgi:dipeptidyl aminopeptidase/acylaminoacyl peptidase
LADARLLVKDRRKIGDHSRDGEPDGESGETGTEEIEVIEVAHEALLREWEELNQTLEEEKSFLKDKAQLELDLADWQATPDTRKKGALLTGNKLTRTTEWLIKHPQGITADERRFIESSSDAAKSRSRRLQAAAVGAFIVITAAALAAAWQWQNAVASLKVAEVERANALEQEDIANKALGDAERNATGGLAALSTIAKDDDPIKSAKLALAAWPRTASSESVQLEEVITNLSDAAPKLLERDWLRRRSTEIAGAAFSGDGAFFAIHKRGGEIVLREVESGQEILSHEGYTEIAGFAFSPDGRYFAASSSDHAALLWELSSQAGPVRLPAGGGQIATVAFSPTGLLLVGSVFGEVSVWDPSDATGPKSRFNIETPPLRM